MLSAKMFSPRDARNKTPAYRRAAIISDDIGAVIPTVLDPIAEIRLKLLSLRRSSPLRRISISEINICDTESPYVSRPARAIRRESFMSLQTRTAANSLRIVSVKVICELMLASALASPSLVRNFVVSLSRLLPTAAENIVRLCFGVFARFRPIDRR